jgi:endonuclease/exonuclease/phosphatase family metal-dependent hydrolase
MKIKTIQWNIGGGRIRTAEGELPGDFEAYDRDGMKYIADTLRRYGPDIVFLQETHENGSTHQVRELAEALGYGFFFNDVYAESHIEEEQGLGQGIISRFPIDGHEFEFFKNPKLEMATPSGKKWVMHDKGISHCSVRVDGDTSFSASTLHLFPLRKFGADWLNESLADVRRDIAERILKNRERLLLQGDFNYDDSSLRRLIPEAFSSGRIQEILLEEPTTPRGRKYDHAIYAGLRLVSSKILSDALTDHYPVYSEFEL